MEEVPKLERKRWFILAIFCFGSAANAFHWLEYGILSDIIKKQYDVSQSAVNWFSLIYCVAYIPLIFPITWYSEKHGLLKPIVFGSFGTALAGCLKIFAVKRPLFWLAMLAQGIAAACQVCFLGMPAILAATWFGAREVSLATAIGVFGNQVGSAVGCLVPSMFVSEGNDVIKRESQLYNLTYFTAAWSISAFLLAVIFFRNNPESPPSYAQAAGERTAQHTYLELMRKLFLNLDFVLLFITYGIIFLLCT